MMNMHPWAMTRQKEKKDKKHKKEKRGRGNRSDSDGGADSGGDGEKLRAWKTPRKEFNNDDF